MTSRHPWISLVVPAHNEEAYLPGLLESVQRSRDSYFRGGNAVEVIVADNQSTDRTRELAENSGCRVEAVEQRIIGAVRNGGARIARGEILAFVDADARLHPTVFSEIDELMSRDGLIGGASGIEFERNSVGLRCTYSLLVLLSMAIRGIRTLRPLNVDGGLVFCRRRDFFDLGGYPEDELFAEDVRFLLALKRLGRSRGQKLVSGTDAKTVFSTRKFDRHGDWHYFRVPFWIAWGFITRSDAWARSYWYQTRGEG